MTSAEPLSPHDLVRIAARAGVDPRAVRRFATGAPMRSTTKRRVQDAMHALGFAAEEASTSSSQASSRP
jgi:DNA-binding LacI/PurR family transcriptional regulator